MDEEIKGLVKLVLHSLIKLLDKANSAIDKAMKEDKPE